MNIQGLHRDAKRKKIEQEGKIHNGKSNMLTCQSQLKRSDFTMANITATAKQISHSVWEVSMLW